MFRFPTRTKVIVAAVVALSAVVVGARPTNAATTPPTARQSFLAEADKVCAQLHETLLRKAKKYETHKLSRASGAGTKDQKVAKPADVGAFVKEVAAPEIDATVKRLRLLRPPADDQKAYTAMLDEITATLARVKKSPDAAAWNDPFAVVDKKMTEFGFQVCGHRPGEDPASKEARKK